MQTQRITDVFMEEAIKRDPRFAKNFTDDEVSSACNHADDIEPGRRFPKGIYHPWDYIYNAYVLKAVDAIHAIEPAYLKSHDLTPNAITLLVNVIRVLIFACIYTNKTHAVVFLMLLQFIGDDMDGHYARKYCQETRFGDMFDHIGDVLFGVTITAVLTYMWPKTSWTSRGMGILTLIYVVYFTNFLFPDTERLRTNVDPSKMMIPSFYTSEKDSGKNQKTITTLRGWPHNIFYYFVILLTVYVLMKDYSK